MGVPSKFSLRRPGPCALCGNHASSPWRGLDRLGAAELDGGRVPLSFARGQWLVSAGQPANGLYCLKTGTVGVQCSDGHGRSMMVRVVDAEGLVGALAPASRVDTTTSVEALTETTACFIRWSTIEHLMARSPTVAVGMVQSVANALHGSEEALLRVSSIPIRGRVAKLLLQLRERHGQVDEAGTLRIDLPLPRHAIASLLATRPETLARTIRELTDAGVAVFEGRKVTVSNVRALELEVEVEK